MADELKDAVVVVLGLLLSEKNKTKTKHYGQSHGDGKSVGVGGE